MSDRERINGESAERPLPKPRGQGVVDLLGPSLSLERSEAEWLLTFLSAEELRHIFEGPTDDQDPD